MHKHEKEQLIDFWSNNPYNISYFVPLHIAPLVDSSQGSLQVTHCLQMVQVRPLNCSIRLLKITISNGTYNNLEYFAYIESYALPSCVSSLQTKL